jgi:outer membrane protein assembly factor BamA
MTSSNVCPTASPKMKRKSSTYSFVLLFLGSALSSHLYAMLCADSSLTVVKIAVTGNETTKEFVILREMSVKVGSLLDSTELEQDQKRIYSLQLFNRVDVDYTAAGTEAIVTVKVSERWYIFPFPIIGFKYHDIKNFYYGAGLVHQNFRGRNEKIMASGAFGFDPWYNLSYRNPKLTEDDLFLQLQLSATHMRNQNSSEGEYDQQILSGFASLGKRFGLFTMLTGLVGYDEWKVDDRQQGATLSPDGKDHYVMLSAGLVYDTRDLREYPLDGDFFSVAATKFGFGESVVNLFRYQIDVRKYQPLGSDMSLGARGFGNFLGGGNSPSYLHAYFGYFDRIRGYYSTILEGEEQIGGSVELRLGILKPRYLTVSLPGLPPEFSVWRYGLYAGIFADAGTTWYRTESFSSVPWHAGYGAGLHFLLPYSFVLRTEYAFNQQGRGEFILGFHASF